MNNETPDRRIESESVRQLRDWQPVREKLRLLDQLTTDLRRLQAEEDSQEAEELSN